MDVQAAMVGWPLMEPNFQVVPGSPGAPGPNETFAFPRKMGPPGPENPTAGSASPSYHDGFQNGWEIFRYVPLTARNGFFVVSDPFSRNRKIQHFQKST